MSSSALAIKTAQNESIWRERLARQAASGKTIAVFCREEGVGKSTLSYWRRRLGVVDAAPGQKLATVAAPFLDLGPVGCEFASSSSNVSHQRKVAAQDPCGQETPTTRKGG